MMAATRKIQIRIVGAPELINPLAEELRKHPDDVTVNSAQKVDGPRGFEFGLIEAAAISAIVSSGFAVGNFSLTLLNFLRNAPDQKKKIRVVTSEGEVEIRWRADLTEDQVKKLIESVAKPD
ncbi:hypothetical protein [Paraburkholderia sp. CI3]|uniref:hypothetical protein n=1 Tax=unclassified Paraburkholderia TaxID=2615204 RepID=UPI003D1EB32E